MSAIRMVGGSPAPVTVDFNDTTVSPNVARNPSFPHGPNDLAPQVITVRMADGSPLQIQKGKRLFLPLTWTREAPIPRAMYDDLLALFAACCGMQDTFTYTDEDGETHDAKFASGLDAFVHVPHGLAGTFELLLLS